MPSENWTDQRIHIFGATDIDEEVGSRGRGQVVGKTAHPIVLLEEGLIGRAEIAEKVLGRRLAEPDLDPARRF